MAILVSTVQTKLTERLKDTRDLTSAQLISMAQDLNTLMYDEAVRQDSSRYITSTSYSVGSSPSTHALPSDLNSFNVDGCGLFVQDSSGNLTGEVLTKTGYGSKQRGYYLEGDNIIFTGINTVTVVLKYIPEIAEITTESDAFFVPDRYIAAVVQGMIAMYYRYEEDEERESLAWQKYDPLFARFLDNLGRGSKVILLPSFTQGF